MTPSRIVPAISTVLLTGMGAAFFRGAIVPPGNSRDGSEVQRKNSPSESSAREAREANPGTALMRKLMEGGKLSPPTKEQLRSFVEKEKHSAASLLAAWRIGSDPGYLEDAALRHPDDPRVALAKLDILKEVNADTRQWIDRLKANDPDNGLGWCYEALAASREGSTDAARKALAEAAKRERFDGYFAENVAGRIAAYRSTGMDGLSAEMLGRFGTDLPQLPLVLSMNHALLKNSGPPIDETFVQDVLKLSRTVRRSSESEVLIGRLVGVIMERNLLSEISAVEIVPGTQKLVMERLDELKSESEIVIGLSKKAAPLMSLMDDSELRQYLRRLSVEGETKALEWLISRHSEGK